MKIRSITFKLLPVIVSSFVLLACSVLALSYVQLTRIVDRSQEAIYAEKVDVIWETLKRADERLQRTGLVEAYQEDFQQSTVLSLRNTYYRQAQVALKPIIVDLDSVVIMHPDLDAGQVLASTGARLFSPERRGASGSSASFSENDLWYIYRVFEPWGWIVAYEVPHSEKYADVRKFSWLLLVTLCSIALFVVVVLSLIIARLMRPVTTLMEVTDQISRGNLDQAIDIRSSDEIGALATSFDRMRRAIQSQIRRLHEEVTERKRIADELHGLENYLSDIINSMPSAIISIDSEMRISQWNSRAAKITGKEGSAVQGKPLAEVYGELAELCPLIEESMHQGEPRKLARRERTTGDEPIYEDITIYPLELSLERGGGAVIRIDDVTKEHELEQQLHHSRKMDAIGQLAGGVAHDFNNMLAGILGAAQLLQVAKVDDASQREKYIDIIIKSASRASELTRKLLAFGRKGKIVSTSINIHELLDDTVDILTRTIDRKVSIERTYEASQPLIVGDTSGLQNVFMNLGINASHAMPDGGTLQIRTENAWLDAASCEQSPFDVSEGEYVRITFEDNGCGIAPEHMGRIFEPFFTTKDHGKGAGLGLAAAYGTTLDHKGAILVESSQGRGTTFTLLFPCSDERNEGEPRGLEVARGAGVVLLVDDEDVVRVTGKHMLEEMGYTVHLATTGTEAVKFIEGADLLVDVVIMDMVMPEMGGREAIERIRRIDTRVKIIISSGFMKKQYVGEYERLGIAGFIHKPYRMAELSQLMRRVSRSRSRN